MGISKLRLFLILLLASLVIYSGSLKGEFLLDDHSLIINNEYIKHIKTLPLLFTTHVFSFSIHNFETNHTYYRPLQTLSFAFDYAVWRLNPFGYHLTNVIMHSLNAFLVFLLIYWLFTNYPLAFLTSILFCIHPMQSEAVSFISGRSELLVSLFTLLSVVSYLSYLKSRRGLFYLTALVSFIFALLSREAGFLLLLPFFILALGIRSKLSRSSVWAHFFSFAAVLAIYIELRLTILFPIKSLLNSQSSFLADLLNFSNVLIEYIYLFIFPHGLHIFRSIQPSFLASPFHIILPVFFLILLAAVSLICIRRKNHVVLFGIGWFVFTLLYLARGMHKFQGSIAMEEHWAYLASLGFFIIVAYLILSINKRVFAKALTVCIIIIYGGLAFINSSHWKNELAFYRYNLKFIEPSLSIIPRLNFSTALYKHGLYQEAIGQVNFILSLAPNNLFAYIQLGDIFRVMKKFPEAKQAYKDALKIDYFCWQANRKLEALAKEMGEVYVLDMDPRFPPDEARIISFMRMGEFDKAMKALAKELSVKPSPQLYTLCGITYGKVGLYNQAIEAFNAALKLDPGFLIALHNLEVAYLNTNRPDKAAEVARRIKEIK